MFRRSDFRKLELFGGGKKNTKVFKVEYIATGQIFALKEVEAKNLDKFLDGFSTKFNYDTAEIEKEIFKTLTNISKDLSTNLPSTIFNIGKGIVKNKDKLIKKANKYLKKDWTIDRLSKVDQAILLLGVYELLYTDTPSVVAINEAIELSKKYSDEAVTKMINGVLDKIYHDEEK